MRRLTQQQLKTLRLWRPQLMQRLKLLLQLPVQWRRHILEPQLQGSMKRNASIGHWRFSKRRLRHCASYGSPGHQPTKPAQLWRAQLQVYLI